MKSLILLLLASVLSSSVVAAEDEAPTEEQLVIKVEHADVDHLQEMLMSVTKGNINVLSDANASKLIVIAPVDRVSAVLGLVRELDRPVPVHNVRVVEVAISPNADIKLSSGVERDVVKAISEASDEGLLKIIQTLELAALDNTVSKTSTEIPTTSKAASANSARGMPFGTNLSVTTRAAGNGVRMMLDYTHSRPNESTVKVTTSFRIDEDQAVVIRGSRPGPDDKPVIWALIVSSQRLDSK